MQESNTATAPADQLARLEQYAADHGIDLSRYNDDAKAALAAELSSIDQGGGHPIAITDHSPGDFLSIMMINDNLERDGWSIVLPLLPDVATKFPDRDKLQEALQDPRGGRAYWRDAAVGNDSLTPGHILTAEEFDTVWDAAEAAPVPGSIDEPGPAIVYSEQGEIFTAEEFRESQALTAALNDPGRHVIVPAGTYYLGDPSYAVPDDHWMPLLHSWDYDRDDISRPLGYMRDGTPVVAFPTVYGDGVYGDGHGNAYPVDTGLIGLVPVTPTTEAALTESTAYFAERNCDGWYDSPLMQRVTFAVAAHCANLDGELLFFESHEEEHDQGYRIDTRDYDLTPVHGEHDAALIASLKAKPSGQES